jgi:hypothetical protein
MAADGNTVTNRLDNTTERKLHAKVVDNVLTGNTYMSRLLGTGKPFMGDNGVFNGKTADFTVDIENSTQFEWFTGLETLNSSAEDTTIVLSYAHTAGTQPKVSIMLESFANAGAQGTIPLDAFLYEKAAHELLRNVASAAYSTGTSDRPNGLQAIVDDGTNAGTIGGQSRTTYSALNATYTDSSGTVTLAKLGTLDDSAATGGESGSVPNVNLTTFTVWSLYEQLIDPQVRANYQSSGFPMLGVRSRGTTSRAELGGGSGFMSLHHRGMPVIKDKAATSGVWYKLNEDTFGWMGRSIVPDEYKGMLTKVTLGSMRGYESTSAEENPSEFNGFFYQKPQMMPDQAGTIARFYVIGQIATKEPRKNGQLHSITGV